eukprot:Clim_evm75s144 gene=Clim_evmTU75s144
MAESLETNLVTLTRHTISQQQKFKGSGDFTLLLASIQLACKYISNAVRKAGVISLTGLATGMTQNSTGDDQKKLDVLADEVFVNALATSGRVSVMVSEERETAILVKDLQEGIPGAYCVVFDPLDGSSNIDAGVSIGTIFGVYHVEDVAGADVKDVLKPGSEMVCAGYAMYGASTNLVISYGHGVHSYTLDPSIGEFVLVNENLRIPKKGKVYSINEGNTKYFDEPTLEYIASCKDKPKSLRYIGSMVADVHRTILYGGIFMYPGDSKSKKGKLRILYEGFPMAYICEQAGGKAVTGSRRVLDVEPEHIHDRCPIFLGSPEDVEEVQKLYAKHGVEK